VPLPSSTRSMRSVRGCLAGALALALTGALLTAGDAAAGTPLPKVEGPVPGAAAGSAPYDVTGAGYVEEEYFFSGTAKTYTTPSTTAAYKMRMLVYRPKSPQRFTGTAIVEWENVTGNIPGGHPMFSWLHSYAIPRGHVYVQVAAQAVPAPAGFVGQGQLGYQAFDPRYASLAHPGDDYSFDIYSQAMRSLTKRLGVSPVGALKVKREIAIGNSQSASRLDTYVNTVQKDARIADAFLLDAGGSKAFPAPPTVPLIHLLSEDGFSAAAPTQTKNYRLWEVSGASHNDAEETRHLSVVSTPGAEKQSWADHVKEDKARSYGEEGLSQHATCALGVGGNEFPRRYAVAAAVDALDRWIRTDMPASSPARVEFDANGQPLQDAYGNTKGGLRLPPIDVPVARYFGDACLLFGMNVPLPPTTLSELYPSHADYVAKMQTAAQKAVTGAFLLQSDADELLAVARASSIGGAA
jgi:hypothetical protein